MNYFFRGGNSINTDIINLLLRLKYPTGSTRTGFLTTVECM